MAGRSEAWEGGGKEVRRKMQTDVSGSGVTPWITVYSNTRISYDIIKNKNDLLDHGGLRRHLGVGGSGAGVHRVGVGVRGGAAQRLAVGLRDGVGAREGGAGAVQVVLDHHANAAI
jgi:hypothetical protein